MSQEAVAQFMGITGVATLDEAGNFLEMAGGDLAQAVELYMDLQGGGGSMPIPQDDIAPAQEEVRAPIESFNDQIVQQQSERDQRHIERLVQQDAEAMQARMAFDQGGNLDNEESGDAPKVLNKQFAAPSFNEDRPWFECMQKAQESQRWIFANIQHKEVFDCHVLNRDIWSDETVSEVMMANFIFWQRDTETTEGAIFCERYKIDPCDKIQFPNLQIIDPRTGQSLKRWIGSSWCRTGPLSVCDILINFLDQHSLTDTSLDIGTMPTTNTTKRLTPDPRPSVDKASVSEEPAAQRKKEEPVEPPPAPIAQRTEDIALPVIDDSKVTTQVQIRFYDGSKRAVKFNEDHTIQDLHNVIENVLSHKNFSVVGGFPPKPFSSMEMTIKDAGICQSAVTVRNK